MLAWRLSLVLLGSMLFLAAIVSQYIWLAVDNLDDVSLRVQAEQIIRHIEGQGDKVRLTLPEDLRRAYHGSGDGYLYAVLDEDGDMLFASSDKARGFMSALPAPQLQAHESYFKLLDSNGRQTPYFAMVASVPGHPQLRVVVAQGYIHWEAYIESLLTEFAEHVGWALPLILTATLLISIYTIRSSLRPLKTLSAQALLIGPTTSSKRLPALDVPDEVLPLITAINSALDRLENGFQAQRRFTANAAHELRTPLAVLTARLSELDDSETARSLADDVARMNRLVSQLLQVSRLDGSALRLEDEVDLNQIAADVVSFLAPLAIRAGRSLALRRSATPVIVKASTLALEDAVRNLVENALSHTPVDTEVAIKVGEDGSISIRDHGPGVPKAMRQQIFERFWRGRRDRGRGAGLGLAIVAETMRLHDGSIEVRDAEDGGAEFVMHLPLLSQMPAATA